MEWKALFDGIWEMAKDALFQKILASGLPARLDLPCIKGVSCVVTGSTSGIGLHTARQLAIAGAHVIMACRNTQKAVGIVEEWQKQHNEALSVEVMELELTSMSSVRSFAANLLSTRQSLDILVNNAGIYRMGEPQKFTKDGNEQHMQVNHLAPALLTLLLLPLLLKSGRPARIINVNTVAHHCAAVDPNDLNLKSNKRKYACISAYGASKLAHLMFLSELSKKLPADANIDVVAVHPGIVSTNLLEFIESHYKEKSFWRFEAAEGARSVLYCATSERISRRKGKGKFAYYRYDCRPANMCRRATDGDTAQLVWDKTIHILGDSLSQLSSLS